MYSILAMSGDEHYRRLPDGRIEDIRFRFASGDTVRITEGPFQGCVGMSESAVGQMMIDGYLTDIAAYHVVLDEEKHGRWVVTIRWDHLEAEDRAVTGFVRRHR